jgi:hypothetical protein
MIKKVFLILCCIAMLHSKSNIEKAGDIVQILIPTTAYATTFYLEDKGGGRRVL